MDFDSFRTRHYLINPENFGRIFIFIDFGNVRPWANNLWPEENKAHADAEIDIRKLADVCDWINPVKKFFYYGYFRENPELPWDHRMNLKNRSSILRLYKARRAGFLVRTKEIKIIPHYDEQGKFLGQSPKCNFDVEITMDLLTKVKVYDAVVLFSGDSDFSGLLQYLKTKGKKVVVVCARARMSRELQEVADKFIPAESLKGFLRYIKNTPPR